MSTQGFMGGLMQGYDFMEDQRDRRNMRDLRQSRETRASEAHDAKMSAHEEARQWQDKQRQNAEKLNMVRQGEYLLKQGADYTELPEEVRGILDEQLQDEKVRQFMSRVEKDPKKVYEQANKITLAAQGEGDFGEALEGGNFLFEPWIQQGDGKNKRIANLVPMNGKVFAELEYDDEEFGTRATGKPLTTNRKKADQIVREFDIGQAVMAAEAAKELAAMRIRLGDTGPLEQQAKAQEKKAELGLKAWERQNEVEDRDLEYERELEKKRLENEGKVKVARIKQKAEQSGLGKIPGYIEQALTVLVVDEEGNPIRDVDGNLQYQTDPAALAGLSQFALENNIKNWDDAYRAYSQAARQQQERDNLRAAQVAADEMMSMDPYKAKNALDSLPENQRALVEGVLPAEFWQQFEGKGGNAKTVKQRTYPEQQRLTYEQMTPEQIAKHMANKSDNYVKQQLESFVEPEKAARVMELIPQERKVDRNSFKGGLYNMAEKFGFDPR